MSAKRLFIFGIVLFSSFIAGSLFTKVSFVQKALVVPSAPDTKVVNSPIIVPSRAQSPAPVITEPPFDNTLGNNWIAAKYAKEMFDRGNTAAPGVVEKIRIELSPEEIRGKDEATYKKDVTSAFVTVTVDSAFWSDSTLNDDTKKNFVATFVTSVGNIFGGYPHVYISNGIRTVAEGEYDLFKDEPRIILK